MPGAKQVFNDLAVCEGCTRDATHQCGRKLGLLSKCRAWLCDDCGHFDDGRAPLHDHLDADRSLNRSRAEEQAEELVAMNDSLYDALETTRGARAAAERPSKKDVRRARDDLVQLLDELREDR